MAAYLAWAPDNHRMSERVIPLIDQRLRSHAATVPAVAVPATGLLGDALGRPLRDLRISVTDRCNFRCSYCMPKEVFDKDYAYLPHSHACMRTDVRAYAGHMMRTRCPHR